MVRLFLDEGEAGAGADADGEPPRKRQHLRAGSPLPSQSPPPNSNVHVPATRQPQASSPGLVGLGSPRRTRAGKRYNTKGG